MTEVSVIALVRQCSPQQSAGLDTAQIMRLVIFACLPGVLVSTWFFGIGMLLNIAIAIAAALFFEGTSQWLRRQPAGFAIADNSAMVTAVLLGIAIPPGANWMLIAGGVCFAIIIGKQVFGGLGQNPFNPAMCGYAFLLLSFPLEMTSWYIPVAPRNAVGFSPISLDSLTTSLRFSLSWPGADRAMDGLAAATPLLEQKLAANSAIAAAWNTENSLLTLLNRASGTGWELTNMAFLLGGLFLLLKGIISWRIPLSIIATIVLLSLVFYSENSVNVYGSPYLHLFGTATMLGAFFIATDPVSSSSTPLGKLIYGVVIGASMYSIRVWGSYLDSVAFAVLAGNLLAPLIDRFTLPRVYGHRSAQR